MTLRTFALIWALTLVPTALAAEDPAKPPPAARVLDANSLRQRLGLLPSYANVPAIENLKIAVLDHGFEGLDGTRAYLPPGYVVVEHYDVEWIRRFLLGDPDFRKPFEPGNAHGRQMAQIAWAAMGFPAQGPRFYLLNANGPTLFRRAVRYAIDQRVDIILFSGSFEGAGNYDGRGPINAVVDEALTAGILWVNAAGNFGGAVHNAPVKVGPDGWVRLGVTDAVCFRNRLDENSATITLTWNDYRDTEDAGTDKDLDLILEDPSGQVAGRSELRQIPADAASAPGTTRNPRERVVLKDLPASEKVYRVRVRAHSGTFTDRDRLRILITPGRDFSYRDPGTGVVRKAVEFIDASESGEVYPPADHPGVLTVGEAGRSSSLGPTTDGRLKPDVILESGTVRFSNGDETGGSSNAAALFAGALAVLKASQPTLRAEHVRTLAQREIRPPSTEPFPSATPGKPLTPNQERALRYAEETRRLQQAQGKPPGGVRMTPSGRLVGEQTFRPVSPSAPVPATPSREPPRSSAGPVIRRSPPPFPPWRAPSPNLLAEVVRGGSSVRPR